MTERTMNRRQLFVSSSKAALATTFGGRWLLKPAAAQQIRGAPGSPSAAEFPDSRVLSTPTPPLAGHIMPNAIDSTPAWPPQTMPPLGLRTYCSSCWMMPDTLPTRPSAG